MYLKEIHLTFIQPCTEPGGNVLFKAKLSNEISEILPYINAILNNAMYNRKSQSLSFKQNFTLITLRNKNLHVCKALNETHAYEIMDFVKSLINDVYEKKKDIEPFYEMRHKPTVLEIYKYLPKLNCKKCSEATCIAFASKLLMGQQTIKNCNSLYDEDNKEKLDEIEDIVQMLGY